MARGELFGDQDHMGVKDPGYTGRPAGGFGARYVPYEYAGFHYRIWLDADGKVKSVETVENQHPAANKDKHRRAVREMFEGEQK